MCTGVWGWIHKYMQVHIEVTDQSWCLSWSLPRFLFLRQSFLLNGDPTNSVILASWQGPEILSLSMSAGVRGVLHFSIHYYMCLGDSNLVVELMPQAAYLLSKYASSTTYTDWMMPSSHTGYSQDWSEVWSRHWAFIKEESLWIKTQDLDSNSTFHWLCNTGYVAFWCSIIQKMATVPLLASISLF